MKKYLVLLVPLLFLIAQCRKEPLSDMTTLEGSVVEYGTKKPIPNAVLKLNKSTGRSGWVVNWETIDTFRTDLNGNYKYSFKHETFGNYELVLRRPPLYGGDINGNVINGKTTQRNFVLNPPFWLNIRVQNINPLSQKDTIIVSSGAIYSILVGTKIDTLLKTSSDYGNHFIGVNFYTIKGDKRKETKDSVFCPAHDTTYFTIKY
jgi:hypothetical protein